MRNLIIALIVVLFSISTVSADYSYCYKISDSGIAIPCDEITKEVYVDSLALPFSDSFMEAMGLEGDTLLVKENKNIVGRSNLIENSFLIKNEYIYYDSVFNNINYFSGEHELAKISFAYIWILIAIILMLISNILFVIYKKKKSKKLALDFYAFLTSCISVVAVCITLVTLYNQNFIIVPAIIAAAITAGFAVSAILYNNVKKYAISSIIFYIIATLLMIFM